MSGGKQRNTIDAVICLTHDIDFEKKKKKVVFVLLHDVKGTFHNVFSTRLYQTLPTLIYFRAISN